jgi:hypothetical protein
MAESDEKAAAKRAERRAKLMGAEDGPRQVVVGWGKRPEAAPAEGEAKAEKADKPEKAEKPAKESKADKGEKKGKDKK